MKMSVNELATATFETLLESLKSLTALLQRDEDASGDIRRAVYNIEHELLRRLNGWKDIALFVSDCEAATLENIPKSTSKHEQARHAHICADVGTMLKCGMLVNHRISSQPEVEKRLADAVAKYERTLVEKKASK